MPKPRVLTGTVFHSGHPLDDAASPTLRAYSSSDRVTWGICKHTGRYACSIEDETGIVELGIGITSQDEVELSALKSLARFWPDGAALVTRCDYRTAEILAGAMQGRPHPLHIVMTPFQERVLRTACTIPRGEVRTYGWIAAKIGNAKASRAVANALHNNPVALIIPCHRVVPSTGEVGGYARGTELKTQILKAEGVLTSDRNSLVLQAE